MTPSQSHQNSPVPGTLGTFSSGPSMGRTPRTRVEEGHFPPAAQFVPFRFGAFLFRSLLF